MDFGECVPPLFLFNQGTSKAASGPKILSLAYWFWFCLQHIDPGLSRYPQTLLNIIVFATIVR